MGRDAEGCETLIHLRFLLSWVVAAIALAEGICGCVSRNTPNTADCVIIRVPDPSTNIPPSRVPYEIVTLTRDVNMKCAYDFELKFRVPSRRDFKKIASLKDDVRRYVREDYDKTNEYVDGTILFVDFPSFEDKFGIVTGKAVVMSIFSDVEMEYNAATSRGRLRLRFDKAIGTDAAREWARRNIEKIVRDKNVRIRTGEKPPEGEYYSLSEVWHDNVLEIEFKAEN